LSDWLSSHFGGHGYFLPQFLEAFSDGKLKKPDENRAAGRQLTYCRP
jgi:hypothetical protein